MVISIMVHASACNRKQVDYTQLNPENTTEEKAADHKLVVYQTLVRHFGNTNQTNKPYGSITENGVGKFDDYTPLALKKIKELGVTHVWYTGVIEHATMTDYTEYGIAFDDPDIVKGRAGSPYAIKDYYDVSPDLAVDVPNRMAEFEALVQRTHTADLKAIIDFVPNHVARTYASDAKPDGVSDFGADDDYSVSFSPTNDYYYLPGEAITMPEGYNAGGNGFSHPMKDGHFEEFPARVTGNNVFSSRPSLNDWSETVKLNYGVDVQDGNATYFDPTPPVWLKMRDILLYWVEKGVDGFRCDVAEMVPVEFWNWVITEVKIVHPDVLFIAEAYNPKQYGNFLEYGKFDYLYDKVGLYDGLKKLIRDEQDATVESIRHVWKDESRGFSNRMLRFLENHDEERIASRFFAGDPWYAVPAMVISSTLSAGPIMVYGGQEVGEPAEGDEGFGGDDGRTSIFDYWGVPRHQEWMNDGRFDGGRLSDSTRHLREFYYRLLTVSRKHEAIREGRFYDLTSANAQSEGFDEKVCAYLRFTENEKVLIIANFNRGERQLHVSFPNDVIAAFGLSGLSGSFSDLLGGNTYTVLDLVDGLEIEMPATSAVILAF